MTMMMAEQLPDGTSASAVQKHHLDDAVETAESNMTEVAVSTENYKSMRRSISSPTGSTNAPKREESPRGAPRRKPPGRNITFVEKFFQKPTAEEEDAPQPQLRLTINREAKQTTSKKAPPRRSKSYGANTPIATKNTRAGLSPPRNARKHSPPGRINTMTKEDVRRQLSDDPNNNTAAQMLSMITGASDHKKGYGSHTGAVERLSYDTRDLQSIANDKEAFAKLKKTLKKHGAVTNEVLKQVLPLYVKHHQDKNSLSSASAHATTGRTPKITRPKHPQDLRATVNGSMSPIRDDSSLPLRGRRRPRADRRKQASLSPTRIRRSRSPKPKGLSESKHITGSFES